MRGRPATNPQECWRCHELQHFAPYTPSLERILEVTGYRSAEALARHLKAHGQPIPDIVRVAYNAQHQERKNRRRKLVAA